MCGASELLHGVKYVGSSGPWALDCLLNVCMLISYCQLHIGLIVCGANEILLGMVEGLVVAGPTYVTGPATTEHICTNNTCLENDNFLIPYL